MEPKCLPESSQNRSWDHLGPRCVPKMVQETLQPPIFMFFCRFCLHFWWFLDQISIYFRTFVHCLYHERRNDRTKHRLVWAGGIPLADYNFNMDVGSILEAKMEAKSIKHIQKKHYKIDIGVGSCFFERMLIDFGCLRPPKTIKIAWEWHN